MSTGNRIVSALSCLLLCSVFFPSLSAEGIDRDDWMAGTPLPSLHTPEWHWWASTDYLLWWTKSSHSPSLVISGPAPLLTDTISTSPPPPNTNYIGYYTISDAPAPLNIDKATDVLFGGRLNKSPYSGVRFRLGTFLDCAEMMGLEGSYLLLANRTKTWKGSPCSYPVLAIPYYDVENAQESSYPIHLPTVASTTQVYMNTTPDVYLNLYNTEVIDSYSGSLSASSSSNLQAGNLIGIWKCPSRGIWSAEWTAGIQSVQLDEHLKLKSSVARQSSSRTTYSATLGLPCEESFLGSIVISQIQRKDHFRTLNKFYGLEIGARGWIELCDWKFMGSGQISLGGMTQRVQIKGSSQFTTKTSTVPYETISINGIPLEVATGDAPVTTTLTGKSKGGLFAQPTNTGRHKRLVFAAVFQGELKAAYPITCNFGIRIGYTFLYLSSVVRPGDQIDRRIDGELLATPPSDAGARRPRFCFSSSDYWAQGLNVGLDYDF